VRIANAGFSYAAIAPAECAEMFPTRIRTTGIAFPYAIAVAACGTG
jgi:MHS family alpha-ketoglutarate permease-like MFS transporter